MARTCEVWLYVRIPRNIRMINYAPFLSLLNACFSFVLLSIGSILCALSEYFERMNIYLSFRYSKVSDESGKDKITSYDDICYTII